MLDEKRGEGGSFSGLVPLIKQKMAALGLLQQLMLGIFIPIILAFLVIGLVLFVDMGPLAGIRHLGSKGLREISQTGIKEATVSLNKLGETIIQAKAEGVARQIEIYLETHPGLSGTSLLNNARLQEIAVQRVGETGYTAVHNDKGINYFHVNPKIAGSDLHKLAAALPDFVTLMDRGLRGPAGGYYNWTDVDGKVRPKFMFTTPVEGTNLIVAATTYIDEFGRPAAEVLERLNRMEADRARQFGKVFTVFLVVVLLDLLVLLVVIYLYSASVVRPIRHLSEVADRISMGELEAPVDVDAKGEVGRLAHSIERMRVSVKTAIERLENQPKIRRRP